MIKKINKVIRTADSIVFKAPDGLWNEEDDFEYGFHKDIPFVLDRKDWGFWCGYVGIPADHPWYEVDYDDIDADVHGGITFGENTLPSIWDRESKGVEEIVEAFDKKKLWWLGFDCGHVCDLKPYEKPLMQAILGEKYRPIDMYYRIMKKEYRTQEYARKECFSLIDQALDEYKIKNSGLITTKKGR